MAPRVAWFGLVFLLSLASFASMVSCDQCTYIVRVKTGDRESAGTDSTVSLKMASSSGDGFTVNNLQDWGLMAPDHDYFERGNLDLFSGTATCIDICSITVTSNGEGYKPGWYLDYVEISIIGGVSKKVAFPVNQWLALDEWPYHLYATVNLCSRSRSRSRFLTLKPTLSSA